MPRSADGRSELFARALDGGAGVPEPDEQLRRELAMVSLLVSAGRQVRPDDAARVRMRARIMAEFAEPVRSDIVTPITVAARRRSAAVGVHGRLLVAAAAALCLLMTLSGMSLGLARDALPGDALYGVKRSAESAELGLTFGDEPRGFKHLQFATARVDELEALAARAFGSTGDANRYLTALQAFDTDAAAGSRLLIETATNGGGSELAALRAWAEQQRLRLQSAGAAMPSRAAVRSDGSTVLLDRVIERVSDLQERLGCLTVTSGARDDIGLLPAGGNCVPAPTAPGGQSTGMPDPDRPRLTQPARPPLVIPGSPEVEDPTAPLGPLDPGVTEPEATLPTDGSTTTEATSPGASTTSTTASDITVPLPLPLLPPITLPPLLPDLPGLKIG